MRPVNMMCRSTTVTRPCPAMRLPPVSDQRNRRLVATSALAVPDSTSTPPERAGHDDLRESCGFGSAASAEATARSAACPDGRNAGDLRLSIRVRSKALLHCDVGSEGGWRIRERRLSPYACARRRRASAEATSEREGLRGVD